MIDLFSTGAYLRCPGGNVERPDLQKPVISWAALNIGGDPCVNNDPLTWTKQRQVYSSAGIPYFPWLHCRNIQDVERLIATGIAWSASGGEKVIGLNIEDVVSDKLSLQEVAGVVLDYWVNPHGGQVHMATLPWVQNGQGWQYLSFAVSALEINPDENEASKHVQDCIDHAFAEGLNKVTLMYGTKAPGAPGIYDLSICHSLYTGDDIPVTPAGWNAWVSGACSPAKPSGGIVPLTEKQFPFTGPFYGPSNPKGPDKAPTIKGVKRGMVRLGLFQADLSALDEHYNADLEDAIRQFQRDNAIVVSGQYGRATWNALRYARVPPPRPNSGQYAMDAAALKLVRSDTLAMCYPHPSGSMSSVCQGLHQTAGLTGNWAIDFCAPGGTKVVAVERATIRKLSGRDPSSGADQVIGIFGWSIHYETAVGYRYFSTHYGARASLSVGQVVDVGQVVGTVGTWPGDPGRSHTHLGVTSPLGIADAKKRITVVSQAQKVA